MTVEHPASPGRGRYELPIGVDEKTDAAQHKLDVQGVTISLSKPSVVSFVDSASTQADGKSDAPNDADRGKAFNAPTKSLTTLRSLIRRSFEPGDGRDSLSFHRAGLRIVRR